MWHRYLFQGAWQRDSAGGCTNHTSWTKNPQYGITTGGQANSVFVSLMQQDVRMLEKTPDHSFKFKIGFMIFKSDNNKVRLTHAGQSGVVGSSGAYINYREVTGDAELAARSQYIVLVTTFEPNQLTPFCLVVYSSEPIVLHYIFPDGHLQATQENDIGDMPHAFSEMQIKNY